MVGPLALLAALLFTMLNPVVSQAATSSSVAPYVGMGEWPTPALSARAGDLAVCNNIPQQPDEFAKILSAFNG